ncbi:MAG: hypothetical protein V1916_03400, partial [Patescibacteria group bacterium]
CITRGESQYLVTCDGHRTVAVTPHQLRSGTVCLQVTTATDRRMTFHSRWKAIEVTGEQFSEIDSWLRNHPDARPVPQQ